jgi:hypothetical protein
MAGQNSEMGRGMMDWGYGIVWHRGGWNDPYNLVGDRLGFRNRLFNLYGFNSPQLAAQ